MKEDWNRELLKLCEMIMKKIEARKKFLNDHNSEQKKYLNTEIVPEQPQLLNLQQLYGNSLVGRLLEEEDSLTDAWGCFSTEEKINQAEILKQYIPGHRQVAREEYPQEILELKFPNGNLHLGYLHKEKRVTMVAVKDYQDNKEIAMHGYQKEIYANRATLKSEFSQNFLSQDWDEGAVAINVNIKKTPGKFLKATGNFMNENEQCGSLAKVTPFLNVNKNLKDKDQLQKIRNEVNSSAREIDSCALEGIKSSIDKKITQQETIINKKEATAREVTKKVAKSFNELINNSKTIATDDFFDLLLKRRREMLQGLENSEEPSEELEEEERQNVQKW